VYHPSKTEIFIVLLLITQIATSLSAFSFPRPEAFRLSILAEHEPILIEDDADLILQASASGWLGDGSRSNPYRIEGLEITEPSERLIEIRGTTLFLIINNCRLSGASEHGIYVVGATNVLIVENTIEDCGNCGILFYGCQFVEASRNTITNTKGKAFTLVELLVVISVIALLMGERISAYLL